MALADLFVPLLCVRCGSAGDEYLCAACAQGLRAAVAGCDFCGAPECFGCAGLRDIGLARSLLVYGGSATKLVLALKRRGPRGLARECGALLASLVQRDGLAADVVTWVPAGRRGAKKGFDHAELLARATARALGVPAMRLLKRTTTGTRQSTKSRVSRAEAADHAFAARRAVPGAVLLVDDVLTTGSTAQACASALRARGVPHVDVVTLARSVLRGPGSGAGSERGERPPYGR